MTELSAIHLQRNLKGTHLAENHTIRREGSSILVIRKKEFQHQPFSEENKAFILAQATTAIEQASQETGNKPARFDHRHPSPFSLEVKFRYKKRGEK